MKIGFVGQGWIGKNFANDFEERGYDIVRYSLEKPHVKNKDKIKECDIVFVAVPTPTTPDGFSYETLDNVLGLIGKGKTAVIKSTILPGIGEELQKRHKDIYVLHSPEFLTEVNAAYDSRNPKRSIVGIPVDNKEYWEKAKEVLDVLPYAPYQTICNSDEATFIKYGGNCWYYFKVVYMNMLYDLVQKYPNCKWEVIKDAMKADPMIGGSHLDPFHKNGRGAGGHCFIKDFEAFRRIHSEKTGDDSARALLSETVNKNLKYLRESDKDQDIVKGVYG